jgi:hypothetical protein
MRIRQKLVFAFAIIVVCGAASAQGKFSAWNQGNLYLYNQVGSTTPSYGWGPDWNNTKGIDQEWTFSYSGKDYGFSGTIEFGMSDIMQSELGWFETHYKFDKFAVLTIGKPRMEDYTVNTDIEGAFNERFGNKRFGAALQVTPIQGLSVGIFTQVPTSGVFAKTFNGTSWQVIGTAAPIDYKNNLVGGASYALPKFGNVMAQYSSITKSASVGVRTSIVPKVHIIADYEIGLADTSALTHRLIASAGSSLGPVTLDSDFIYKYAASVSMFAGEAQAEWDSGPYAIGLRLGYDDGKGADLFSHALGSWDGYEIYPYMAKNFDNGSSVNLGIVYATGANGHSSLISVPLIYVWCF